VGAANCRVEVSGPPIKLSAQNVVTLRLSIHELTTNALKYGALSNSDGKVYVSWAVAQDKNGVMIDWVERAGQPVSAPRLIMSDEGEHITFMTAIVELAAKSRIPEIYP
jgi:two-component sensor histidine kinase